MTLMEPASAMNVTRDGEMHPSANIACDTFSKQCSHYVHTIHIRDVYTYN